MRGVCGRNWEVGPKIWWEVGLKKDMRWEVGFVAGGTPKMVGGWPPK